jgi:tRNA U55 pseudouridine synthase TruB
MTELRRTRSGVISVEGAVSSADITLDAIEAQSISAADAVSFLPRRLIDPTECADVLMGRAIASGHIDGSSDESGWIRLIDAAGRLAALADVSEDGSQLRPRRVLIG